MTKAIFIKVISAESPFTIYSYLPINHSADYFCALTKKYYMTSEEIVLLSKAGVDIELAKTGEEEDV